MSVFISHRSVDAPTAMQVYDRLKLHKIEAYLAVLDREAQSAENITQVILDGLRPCTHLIAVISRETAGSWWVPFEIGVATKADQRITTYLIAAVTLPEYLKTWPILRTAAEIDRFAQRYSEDRLILEKSGAIEKAQRTEIRSAKDFHRTLKSDLGQA